MARPPVVKSFLIADVVIQDRMTGKWSIIGVFDRILSPAFPVVHQQVAFYVKMGDLQGRYRIKVDFRDAADKQMGLIEGPPIDIKDVAHSFELGIGLGNVKLDRPGKYQFQLYVNDEFVASAPLDVVQVQVPPPPAAPPA
jgi:hypothetical protein